MIILLASNDQGITLKLHLQGRLLSQARSQEFEMEGGLFRRCDTKLVQFTLGIGMFFFSLKLGEDQKKKKKKKKVFVGVGIEFTTDCSSTP